MDSEEENINEINKEILNKSVTLNNNNLNHLINNDFENL